MILLSYIEIAKIHIIFYIKSFLLHFFCFLTFRGLEYGRSWVSWVKRGDNGGKSVKIEVDGLIINGNLGV